ncbi:MAG: aromatic amino acid lyase [Thermoleophilia bacterium]|nr:aromatic amino acid lyase [Thermoleophilia bacterium]
MNVVTIGMRPLTVEDLGKVARGAAVELHPSAIDRIRAGRAVVEAALAAGEPIYGLNTGVGRLKDVRLAEKELRHSQETLVRTHAGGLGAPESTEVVRAALAVRVNGISRGGSGASLAVAETLMALLNSGVHPVVPRDGSVGAADLPQMAAIGLVAMGEGRAEYKGQILPGGEALRRAGIAPLAVEAKDGLALVSANGISVGRGALVAMRAMDLAETADVAAALSLEAIRGNPSLTLPVVGAAKPYPGQTAACGSMRAALAGSYLLEPEAPASIQDPLSFRVAPQVHGALREFISFARRAVEIELNSMSDNPLVSIEDGTIIHNGNFHPIVLALAFDALRIAVVHVGQLSERRTGHLWDSFFASAAVVQGQLPAGREFPGLALRYAAASQFAELKQLGAPATLDVPPLDMEIEDHATSAPLTVGKTASALELLENLLTIEFLLAGTCSRFPAPYRGWERRAARRCAPSTGLWPALGKIGHRRPSTSWCAPSYPRITGSSPPTVAFESVPTPWNSRAEPITRQIARRSARYPWFRSSGGTAS